MATATLTTPPAELNAAIEKAAALYHVPADILAGIWRVESASTFPNPAVNSKGYGGLFGTTLWNGSTQAQADLSASILANLLRKNGGDIQTALYQYSGGGYNSVPGQTTVGKWDPGQATGKQSQDSTAPGSDQGGGGLGSFFSTIAKASEQAASGDPFGAAATEGGALAHAFGLGGVGDALNKLDPVTVLAAAVSPIGTAFTTIERFFGNLPGYLVRGGLLIGGVLLMVIGFGLLGRQAVAA